MDLNLKADAYGYMYKCMILYTCTYICIYSHNLCILRLLKVDLFVSFDRKVSARFDQIETVLIRKASLLFPPSELCLYTLLYTKL